MEGLCCLMYKISLIRSMFQLLLLSIIRVLLHTDFVSAIWSFMIVVYIYMKSLGAKQINAIFEKNEFIV